MYPQIFKNITHLMLSDFATKTRQIIYPIQHQTPPLKGRVTPSKFPKSHTTLDPNRELTELYNQDHMPDFLPDLLPAFGLPMSVYDYVAKSANRKHYLYMATYAFTKAIMESVPPILQDYFNTALSEHYTTSDEHINHYKQSYSDILHLPVLIETFKAFVIPRDLQLQLLRDIYNAYTVNLSNFLSTVYKLEPDNQENALEFIFSCYKPKLKQLKESDTKNLLKSFASMDTPRLFGLQDRRIAKNLSNMSSESSSLFPFFFLKQYHLKDHLNLFEMFVDENHFTFIKSIVNQFIAETNKRTPTTQDDPITNYLSHADTLTLDTSKKYALPKNLRFLCETHHGITYVTKPYPRELFYNNKLFIDIVKKLMYSRHFKFMYFYAMMPNPQKRSSKLHIHVENAMHLERKAFSLPNIPHNIHATTLKEKYNTKINVVPNINNPSVIPCIRDYQSLFALAGIQTFLFEDYFTYLSEKDLERKSIKKANATGKVKIEVDDKGTEPSFHEYEDDNADGYDVEQPTPTIAPKNEKKLKPISIDDLFSEELEC